MAQLHRVDAIWQFFPAKIYAFIRWNVPQLMQMDRLPPSFGKNPFRNLFNSLSKINPTANTQNMPVGMERKHRITKSKQRGKKKKERRKKNRTGGLIWSMRWIVDPDRIARPRTKIRGWTFDWWTDYISDRICIDYRGGRELPTILDVSIATVRRVCTRSNPDKIRRVNAIVFRKKYVYI